MDAYREKLREKLEARRQKKRRRVRADERSRTSDDGGDVRASRLDDELDEKNIGDTNSEKLGEKLEARRQKTRRRVKEGERSRTSDDGGDVRASRFDDEQDEKDIGDPNSEPNEEQTWALLQKRKLQKVKRTSAEGDGTSHSAGRSGDGNGSSQGHNTAGGAKILGEGISRRAKKKAGKETADKQPQATEPVLDGSSKKKMSEIDLLFSGKRKKPAPAAEPDSSSNGHHSHRQKRLQRQSIDGGSGEIRYTDDGLRIYTYEELMKDQPSNLDGPCPFDCGCCF